MTLEQAIKILNQYSHEPEGISLDDETNAIQLGIEALKFFKDLEDRGALPTDVRLPGETKEGG